jgi:hypothetical protein
MIDAHAAIHAGARVRAGREMCRGVMTAVATVSAALLGAASPALAADERPATDAVPMGVFRTLDDFQGESAWTPIAATGVGLKAAIELIGPWQEGRALRIDYDFTKGSGFVIVQKPVDITLPDPDSGVTYEFAFDVRGEGPANDLEFKLLDTRGARVGGEQGANRAADAATSDVWWVNRRGFVAPKEWTTLSNRTRHVTFAWGPSGGTPLRRVDAIEFAIAASEGGKGTIWLDNLRYREVAPPPVPLPVPVVTVSSGNGDARAIFDGDPGTAWLARDDDQTPTMTIDLGHDLEFGAVEFVLRDAVARRVVIEASDAATDGEAGGAWRLVRQIDEPGGRRIVAWAPESSARRLRASFIVDGPLVLEAARLIRPEHVATRNDLARFIAREGQIVDGHQIGHGGQGNIGYGAGETSPAYPNDWPDYYHGLKRYWTVVGIPGDANEALMSEQGAVEVGKGLFSLEAVVRTGSVFTRLARTVPLESADGTQRGGVSLEDGWMPIPSVAGSAAGLASKVTAVATGEVGASRVLVRYALTNTSTERVQGTFALVARPFQVNPPWQDLKATGGVAPTGTVVAHEDGLSMDGRRVRLSSPTTPGPNERVLGSTLARGEIVSALRGEGRPAILRGVGAWVGPEGLSCPDLMASGAIERAFDLAPGETAEWVATVALSGGDEVAAADPAEFARVLEAERQRWAREVSRVGVSFNDPALDATIKSTLAYILVNADGPGIQPGSRCYERSWIRDGSMTSAALFEFGMGERGVAFVDWYGPYVYPSGKVPCVVDRRGPDPVEEHDSHGQYIFAVMNAYRYTRDRTILERHWPRVLTVVDHIAELRGRRMTAEFRAGGPSRQEPGKPAVPAEAFFGIVPESISHEGYSAKPMHSYWDGFFTIRGLRDARDMALALGETAHAERIGALADEYRASHYASMRLAMKVHGIDYMPGCVELGDFDSTSTTVAVWPTGDTGADVLPMLDATFDRYMRFFRARRDGREAWTGMTPYELRHVGALARLGRRGDAVEVLSWLMGLRRPAAWNHWGEVVWQDRDTPKVIGDMPHTWCGSDFLNSVRGMLLHERGASLVVFGGVPESWARRGVSMEGMPTEFGVVSGTVGVEKKEEGAERFVVTLSGSARVNAGIIVASPFDDAGGRADGRVRAWIDGKETTVTDGEVRVFSLPTRIEFERAE